LASGKGRNAGPITPFAAAALSKPGGCTARKRAPQADLDDIWLYTAKESGSIHVATRLIDAITSRFFFRADSASYGDLPDGCPRRAEQPPRAAGAGRPV